MVIEEHGELTTEVKQIACDFKEILQFVEKECSIAGYDASHLAVELLNMAYQRENRPRQEG